MLGRPFPAAPFEAELPPFGLVFVGWNPFESAQTAAAASTIPSCREPLYQSLRSFQTQVSELTFVLGPVLLAAADGMQLKVSLPRIPTQILVIVVVLTRRNNRTVLPRNLKSQRKSDIFEIANIVISKSRPVDEGVEAFDSTESRFLSWEEEDSVRRQAAAI
jgi:hypothetical protein